MSLIDWCLKRLLIFRGAQFIIAGKAGMPREIDRLSAGKLTSYKIGVYRNCHVQDSNSQLCDRLSNKWIWMSKNNTKKYCMRFVYMYIYSLSIAISLKPEWKRVTLKSNMPCMYICPKWTWKYLYTFRFKTKRFSCFNLQMTKSIFVPK